MFGISFSELLLIFVIAIVIFGPEQLPELARKFGRLVGGLKRMQQSISNQIYQQAGIEELNQLRDDLTTAVNQIRNSLHNKNSTTDEAIMTEKDVIYQELNFLYQPELDFERQPELFDE